MYTTPDKHKLLAAIAALFISLIIVALPAHAQLNPQIAAGSSGTFAPAGNDHPTTPQWDIVLPGQGGQVIASDITPNGWTTSYETRYSANSYNSMTIGVPATASVALNYECRMYIPRGFENPAGYWSIKFDVVNPGQVQPIRIGVSPGRAQPGATCTLTVQLNQITNATAIIALSTTDNNVAPVSSQVKIGAGQDYATTTFTVGTPVASENVAITANYNSTNISTNLYVYLFTVNDHPLPAWAENVTPSDVSGGEGDGPSSADSVNLASGVYENHPGPDIIVRNAQGPSVVFARMYRSTNAARSYQSPGLTAGWTHNFDIVLSDDPSHYGSVWLTYPNGAAEEWMAPNPVTGTGSLSLTPPAGAPYLGSGVLATSGPCIWQSLTMTMADESQWTFTPSTIARPQIGHYYVLSKVSNLVGHSILFNYDSTYGHLTTITDDATIPNVLLGFSYSGNMLNAVTDQTDPSSLNWLSVAYNYGADGNLFQVTLEALNGAMLAPIRWQYTYGAVQGFAFFLLTNVGAPNQTQIGGPILSNSITYDANGRVTKITDADGNQRTYNYTGTTQVTAMDKANHISEMWTQTYDILTRATGAIDANNNGMVVLYTDPNNTFQPTSIINRNMQTSTLSYDPLSNFGNLAMVTVPSNGGNLLASFSYDYSNFKGGRLKSAQVGAKAATSFGYYANNTVVTVNNIAITQPNGLVSQMSSPMPGMPGATVSTSYVYTALGNVLQVIAPGPNGHSVTYTYSYTDNGKTEALGEPTSVIDPLGYKTQFQYNGRGDLIGVVDAIGRTTSYTYNDLHQVRSVTLPPLTINGQSRFLVYRYQFDGGPLMETDYFDENNVQQRSVYYTAGAEGETVNQAGSIDQEQVGFDSSFRPKALTDGLHNVSKQVYDVLGNATNFSFPLAGTVPQNVVADTSQAFYDKDQNLNKLIDGNGQTFQFKLDPADSRVTDVLYPTHTLANPHYDYDEYQRVVHRTDNEGEYWFTYDDLDNVMEARTVYKGQPEMDVTYMYNPDGSRQSMTTPAGIYNYNYDDDGNLLSVTFPWGQSVTYDYDHANRLQHQYQSQVTSTYTFDSLDELTELKQTGTGTGSPVLARYFGPMMYDASGNRTSMQMTVGPLSVSAADNLNGTASWTYDNVLHQDQLTLESVRFSQNSIFAGLIVGNAYQSDAANNLVTLRGVGMSYNADNQYPVSFGYDGNGTPLTLPGSASSLKADVNGQIIAFNDSYSTQAGYRDDGLRAWKQSTSNSSQTPIKTYFLYDGTRVIYATGQEAGAYGYGATGLVQSDITSTSSVNNPLGVCTYLFDPMGNTVSRIYLSGGFYGRFLNQMYDLALYDAFGAPTAYANPFAYTPAFGYQQYVPSPPDAVGYGGEWGNYTDQETGLVLMGYRYYSPGMCRFLTRDPIGYEGGINPYAYCRNNPIMNADPTGLDDTLFARAKALASKVVTGIGNAVAAPFVYAWDKLKAFTRPTMNANAPNLTHPYLDPDLPESYEVNGRYVQAGKAVNGYIDWAAVTIIQGAVTSGGLGGIGKDIALGRDPYFKYLAEQEGAFTWRQWADAGITRRTVANNFGRAFHQAVDRARVVHFALDGIGVEGVEEAVRRGAAGFSEGNMTNAELHHIMTNPAIRAKTIFYVGGQVVSVP